MSRNAPAIDAQRLSLILNDLRQVVDRLEIVEIYQQHCEKAAFAV